MVADATQHAVMDARPGSHYPVGLLARGALTRQRILLDPAFDSFVAKQSPAP